MIFCTTEFVLNVEATQMYAKTFLFIHGLTSWHAKGTVTTQHLLLITFRKPLLEVTQERVEVLEPFFN